MTITIDNIEGVLCARVAMQNAPLILLICKRGFIMCGYLDLTTAEKLGDTACVIRGVSTFEDAFNSKIADATDGAKSAGIFPGMDVRDALRILND